MAAPTLQTAAAARPERPAAPPLPALADLDRTHREMLDVLADLQRLVDHLDLQGVDSSARTVARAVCAYFDGHARQHHADEEAVVFPALLRRGDATLIPHLRRLQQDHGWLEEDWLALAPQLQAVAEGCSGYETEALRHGVAVFTALYHEHIALEESLVYPAARRQLDAEERARSGRTAAALLAD